MADILKTKLLSVSFTVYMSCVHIVLIHLFTLTSLMIIYQTQSTKHTITAMFCTLHSCFKELIFFIFFSLV